MVLYPYYLIIPLIILTLYFIRTRLSKGPYSSGIQEEMEKTYNDYPEKAGELIASILENAEWFRPVKERLAGEIILGIAECLKITDGKDWIKKGAFNTLGRALGKATGVGLQKVEKPFTYYLVSTQRHLHFMAYENGRCREHLQFDFSLLSNVHLAPVVYKDILIYEGAAAPGLKKLQFESNGVSYAIVLYHTILRSPFQHFYNDKQTGLQLFALNKAFYNRFSNYTSRM